MGLIEKVYRSSFGVYMSIIGNLIAKLHKPFMVYGFRDPATGRFQKYTRLSSNVTIMNRKNLRIGDHVWVWHHSILDATEGIEIGEGCQIGAWVGIFSHGSENSIRLLGKQFVHINNAERFGYTRGAVKIGDYSFVAAGSIILPGTTIGKGSLIAAGSVVSGSIPDFSIVVGSPGIVKARTTDKDKRFFRNHDFSETYYDSEALTIVKDSKST